MDQGTVVAIVALAGSFLTVLVTGAVNIWSKYIDSEQKVREHQFSLRNVYVNKKIEAAQEYVAKITLLQAKLYNENSVLNLVLEADEIDDDVVKQFIDIDSLFKEKITIDKDYSQLYFKQDQLYLDSIEQTSKKNNKTVEMYNAINIFNADVEYNEEYFNNIINVFRELINIDNRLIMICRKA